VEFKLNMPRLDTPIRNIRPRYGSLEEYFEIPESVPLPVTPQTCSESEALQLIEEET
jgi:hypothetical protein